MQRPMLLLFCTYCRGRKAASRWRGNSITNIQKIADWKYRKYTWACPCIRTIIVFRYNAR